MSDTPEQTAPETTEAPERLGPFGRSLVATFATVLTLASIAWAADLHRSVGLGGLYPAQFLAFMLAISLPLVFLTVPAKKGGTGRRPWYDIALALFAFAAPAYVAVTFPRLANEIAYDPLDGLIVSVIILVLIVEGLRRAVGRTLVILLLVFLAYSTWGHHIPGTLQGRSVPLQQIAISLALDPQALFGTPLIIATTVVIPFVFIGQLLFQSGGSAFFTEISMAKMGRYRGGAAKIAVTASGLFGSISGSAVSNVVSTGVITIPLMRQSGYSPEAAGGIESVASTGGQLMPPMMGASAFVMAEFLEIPYAEVVLAALIPAALYYIALFILTDLEAARTKITQLDLSQLPDARKVMRAGWYFPLPFGVLLYALFGLNQRPETAALYAALTLIVTAMIFGYDGKRFGPKGLLAAIRETGRSCVDIILIVCAAGLVIGVLNLSGLSYGLTQALVQIAQGNLALLLLLAALLSIVLGMGMPTLGVYVLLAALVAPAMVEVGIQPIAAHLYVLYFGMMSMITPPVAIAAFTAATLANANPMRTALAAVRFGWIAYVIPFLFVASPTLIMQGPTDRILMDAATALVGVWIISCGLMGWFRGPLGAVLRIGFVVAGAAILAPSGLFANALAFNAAGGVLAIVLIGLQTVRARSAREAA